ARVADQIRAHSAAMPGVHEILALCASLGWRIGLASNSPAVLCQLVLSELGIARAFHAVVSADFVEQGKPDPAVYLQAAQRLGVPAGQCIAFEDSATGVRAARAAGMSVVAVPSLGQTFASENSTPHLTLGGLAEFDEEHAAILARRII
ncbi:MAG TPA: HAD-IA family hydrolase, partial [Steroidobacteraceae bacterium]|nr:HAD-IA family hydrolase [Steroidobacteraceae bacterium]